MRGSSCGNVYDEPCSDNVTFMMVHKVTGLNPSQYLNSYLTPANPAILPLFQSFHTTVAMHEPIFPAVQFNAEMGAAAASESSEPITFSLDNVKAIKSAMLYIRTTESIERTLRAQDLPLIATTGVTPVASWTMSTPGLFQKSVAGSPAGNVTVISHVQSMTGLDSKKFTYVTYKFEVEYVDLTKEDMEITFALQDYHDPAHLPDAPAPVYAQGASEQLVDILFIPARNDGGPALRNPEIAAFRNSLPAIIRNVAFYDPTLRFYHSQFNFWVNKAEGEARNFDSCTGSAECCHTVPADVASFELKALMHSADQRDFTDNCNGAFSAELQPERTAFLHELGHASFWLMDEYPGTNGQDARHFPNNWYTLEDAQNDATFRHKNRSDARLITYPSESECR
jgi:hypothetical protein